MKKIINSDELTDDELSCEDCYVKICLATCCCISQIINVILQIIEYYPTDNLIVTLDNGNQISGRPGPLFPNINPGLFQLVDSDGTVQEAVSICKIVSIKITSSSYNENITYKPAPEETPIGCEANCESAISQYLPVDSEVQIKAAGQTIADGIVHINAYTMLVIVDKNDNNPVFVSTCKIESVK